jgi:spermidine/putrescine transport system ATP-binding protein
VASFLGVSNLLPGEIVGADAVRLRDGTVVSVPAARLAGRSGQISIGIRPEKIRMAAGERNQLAGKVVESAYIGISTQYIVDTTAGAVTLSVQNEQTGATTLGAGEQLNLSWSPASTFIVEPPES